MSSKWYLDDEQMALFINGAIAQLKIYKHMRTNASTEDPVLKRALQIWGAPARYDLLESAEAAIKTFSAFASQWEGWTPTITKSSFTKIAVNFVVPYGKGGYVEFLAEGSPLRAETMSLQDLEDAYKELWDYVSVAAQTFWRNPPKMALAAGANTLDPDSSDENVIACEATHILREDKPDPANEKQLKAYYKLFGPKFSKYGVKVYPETLTEAGVNLEKIKPGKHSISKGAKMWVSLTKEDKPIKVVRLQRNT